jgi:hypothetical protein
MLHDMPAALRNFIQWLVGDVGLRLWAEHPSHVETTVAWNDSSPPTEVNPSILAQSWLSHARITPLSRAFSLANGLMLSEAETPPFS